MNSDFEKQLQRQPLREIPPHWRGRILANAQPTTGRWREWFWPCPQAWAALAAAWIVILAVDLGTGDYAAQTAPATPPLSREALIELRQRQETLARLIFPEQALEAEPPKSTVPRRSELRKQFLVA